MDRHGPAWQTFLKSSIATWKRREQYRRDRVLAYKERARKEDASPGGRTHATQNKLDMWETRLDFARRMIKKRERQLAEAAVAGDLSDRAWEEAGKLIGVMEVGGNNMGKRVLEIIKANGGPGPEPWCFAAGTLISTPDGLRRIEDLQDSDVVLTGGGAPAPVLTRPPRVARTVRLRAYGVADTIVSEDHPYLARQNLGRPGRRALAEAEWIPVGNLRRGDFICLPRLTGGKVPFNPASAYVFGRWLADGWTVIKPQRDTQEHRAAFVCCAHVEAGALRHRLVEADVLGAERTYGTVTQFALPVRALPFWDAGGNARNKRVPGCVLSWQPEAREALLLGYLDGDGHEYAPGRFAANTVSRDLAYGIAQVARSVGRAAAVYAYERPTTAVIGGRTVRQAGVRYEMKITPMSQHSHGEWAPVRSVVEAGERRVYNLTVAGEPTFIADGAVVHNCGDFVAFCYRKGGSKAVQRGWAAVKNLGFLTGMSIVKEPKRGDIVCYSFDHTGIFGGWCNSSGAEVPMGAATHIRAREGNTGRTGAVSDSQHGGDGVYEKLRPRGGISRFVHVSS